MDGSEFPSYQRSTRLSGVKSTEHERNLGAVSDLDMRFDNHINSVNESVFYHLKTLSECYMSVMVTLQVSKKKKQQINQAAARVLSKTRNMGLRSPASKKKNSA
ncbi:hypothetical protein AMECASPLE_021875 [Ameca splendens]|uniref:Uncharacterized protein n=1 Tax=Ameca splendens TaxID=208324 RepID=A0ABV0ZDH8_9TELE